MLLRKWRALSRADRRLVIEAAAWFVLVRIALWIVPIASLSRWAASRHVGRPVDPDVRPARIGWATEAVARRLAKPQSCLAQALTAQAMLGGRGQSSTLHFGARKQTSEPFRGHAWLECGGVVLVGSDDLEAFQEIKARPTEERGKEGASD